MHKRVFDESHQRAARKNLLPNPSNRRNAPHPDLSLSQREATKTETCTRFRVRILILTGMCGASDNCALVVPHPNPPPTNVGGNQISCEGTGD